MSKFSMGEKVTLVIEDREWPASVHTVEKHGFSGVPHRYRLLVDLGFHVYHVTEPYDERHLKKITPLVELAKAAE